VRQGMTFESPGLRWLSFAALAGYIGIFSAHAMDWPTYGLRSFQQTLLALALCGFIAKGSLGFTGPIRTVLEHPAIQRIGQLSYGVYLFHNLAPLLAGKIFWFLWGDFFQNTAGAILVVAVFAAITWGLTLACWRWIELPLQGIREKFSPP